MRSQLGKPGETSTVLASFSAVDYMPLLVIFKAESLKAEWLYQAPPNTLVKGSDGGLTAN